MAKRSTSNRRNKITEMEVNMEEKEAQPTIELETETGNVEEVQHDQPAQTEGIGMMEMIRKLMEDNRNELKKQMTDNNKKIEDVIKQMTDINKKMDDNSKKMEENINRKLEDTINKKMDDTNKKMDDNNKKLEDVSKQMTEYNETIKQQILDIREQVQQNSLELQSMKEEAIENTKKIEEKVTTINTNVETINNQVQDNTGKIEEINKKELVNIREELERIKNRPVGLTCHQARDNREIINFRNYQRNPMEFLERVEENLVKTKENRWSEIRSMLDEHFKEMNDNWWTVTRYEVTDYAMFREVFKVKYWSETTQNIVRDNISHGRFDTQRGLTPTAYFLGKVCLARHLEPTIPEECLVTKLAYHYDEGIPRARLYGQIKTIQGMIALLESHEHEGYYRRNRGRPEQTNRDRPEYNRARNNRPNNYNRDNRPYNNNNNNNDNNYNHDNRQYHNNNNGNNYNRDSRQRVNYIHYSGQERNWRSRYGGRRSLELIDQRDFNRHDLRRRNRSSEDHCRMERPEDTDQRSGINNTGRVNMTNDDGNLN